MAAGIGAVSEAKKNLVRRYIDQLINNNRWENAPDILSANFVFHHSAAHDPIIGRDGFRRYTDKFRKSFPDLHSTIEDIFTDGDTVILRVVWSGTHLDNFEGISPTRRAFSIGGTGIYRVRDDLIIEAWAEFDPLELLHQIAGKKFDEDLPEA